MKGKENGLNQTSNDYVTYVPAVSLQGCIGTPGSCLGTVRMMLEVRTHVSANAPWQLDHVVFGGGDGGTVACDV